MKAIWKPACSMSFALRPSWQQGPCMEKFNSIRDAHMIDSLDTTIWQLMIVRLKTYLQSQGQMY